MIEKWVHLPIYDVYTWSYGHQNVKTGPLFVLSADYRKNKSFGKLSA